MLQEDQWYALFVQTGEEDNVKERLMYRLGEQYAVVVPKRKLKERKNGKWTYNTRIMLPGYVLLNGYIDGNTYYRLKGIPGLYKLLRSGNDITAIHDTEMKVLSRLICNSEVIGFSEILMVDGEVKVVDGPLVEMEGRIVSINHRKGRAKVCFDFLGETRLVELGVEMLKLA